MNAEQQKEGSIRLYVPTLSSVTCELDLDLEALSIHNKRAPLAGKGALARSAAERGLGLSLMWRGGGSRWAGLDSQH